MRLLMVSRRVQWAVAFLFVASGTLLCAEEKQAAAETPLLVVSAASVERLLKQADVAFSSAGRPELSETVGTALSAVKDLKGLHREQPVGLYLFLNGLMPQPVAFVPFENIDDLIKLAELGPGTTTKKVAEGKYEIVGRRMTLHAVVQGKYAFVSNEAETLERTFLDPAKATAKLSASYDVAATVNLKAIPEETRDLLMAFLKNSSETELQQRDNEPETAYKIRRAAGESNLALVDQLFKQGEQFTIGWGVSGEQKQAALELVMQYAPGSELAKLSNELHTGRTVFANMLQTNTPLTLSMAARLTKSTKKFLNDVFTVAEEDIKKKLGESADATPIMEIFKVLKATAADGMLDAAVQFKAEPAGPFTLVGGVKLADGDQMATALAQIMPLLKSNPDFAEVQSDAAEYKGVKLHRIQGKEVRPQDEVLYGGKPSLYFGSGGKVLWFAVGGERALPAIKLAIDEMEKPAAEAVAVPFQFVMNLAQWMDVLDRNRNGGFGARARTAFSKGGDSLRVDVRPLENGARLRVQFDEAFLRLVGGEIARRVDENN